MRQKGAEIEKEVALWLESQGYVILERNFLVRAGEVDLVARDRDEIVFVEVRYRENSKFVRAFETVDIKKMKKVEKAARIWLLKNHLSEAFCRFDVVSVEEDRYPRITHFKNIWMDGGF